MKFGGQSLSCSGIVEHMSRKSVDRKQNQPKREFNAIDSKGGVWSHLKPIDMKLHIWCCPCWFWFSFSLVFPLLQNENV